ncbi:MAG: hypothetical protein A3A33_01590 [Candidatus Yanofskybacteria bacterium RIFCSPLOWO2_01_FULL_49_25]|uniref:Glutamine amidotransferase domain-containing protein n=1 Tax=Candidatus Yanofskybacteria bacterium RIFCSPLOWO2_01_FULL_49_25 TaxID=1802701 RepID=A0A1F8GX65_9BACT|nr:MAG: hypothetical protein A3A33_01590 [Candidatus Yanofskybacteria bacterium RIFCSPLOWO2_01_FULL_49_25]
MIIGITQRIYTNEHGQRCDVLEQSYSTLWGAYGTLMPIPNTIKNQNSLILDRIILTGGGTIGRDLDRDTVETSLLQRAVAKRIPVLGICRGAEMINIFFGGLLLDTIPGHAGTTHPVTIGSNAIIVNSYHNQGFTELELAKELRIFAKASDGTIEGINHSSLPIAGIMWHPEREQKLSSQNQDLITAFIRGTLYWK